MAKKGGKSGSNKGSSKKGKTAPQSRARLGLKRQTRNNQKAPF